MDGRYIGPGRRGKGKSGYQFSDTRIQSKKARCLKRVCGISICQKSRLRLIGPNQRRVLVGGERLLSPAGLGGGG